MNGGCCCLRLHVLCFNISFLIYKIYWSLLLCGIVYCAQSLQFQTLHVFCVFFYRWCKKKKNQCTCHCTKPKWLFEIYFFVFLWKYYLKNVPLWIIRYCLFFSQTYGVLSCPKIRWTVPKQQNRELTAERSKCSKLFLISIYT